MIPDDKYQRPPEPESSHDEWLRKQRYDNDPAYENRDCIYYNGKAFTLDDLIQTMIQNDDKIICHPTKGEK